jgi:Ca2+-binding RTX toxin-like protein
MAEINGTNAPENLAGTSADDVIFGFGDDDFINGAGGNDIIDGGAGDDDIIGGDGDDTITGGLGLDTIDAGAGNDTIIATELEIDTDVIDGGDGDDTLVVELNLADVVINQDLTLGAASALGLTSTFAMANMEFVQVTNASDLVLDLGADSFFALDASTVHAAGVTNLDVLAFDASTGIVGAGAATDETAGVIVGGTTYFDTDSFVTADGGTVTVGFDSINDVYTFDYTAEDADGYAVGVFTDDIIGDSVVATVTLMDADASTVDVAVDFVLNLTSGFDASLATAGITSKGDSQLNTMIGSDFDDTIWAGADSADEADTLVGNDGNDTLAGGGGDDEIDGGEGNDTIFAGAGDDGDANAGVFGGLDDDIIFGGAGNDTLAGDTSQSAGTAGTATGDGNDTIYGGSDDGNDTIFGNGGNDTIYGGAGTDALDGGDGDDTIFNGAGVDTVDGGEGDDVIWGGAGNDTLTGGDDNDTFGFVVGNGNDIIVDFEFGTTTAGDLGDVLDLTAFGFTDTQDVIDSMSDITAGGVTLVLGTGQVLTFGTTGANGNVVDVLSFQSAVDDWVLV